VARELKVLKGVRANFTTFVVILSITGTLLWLFSTMLQPLRSRHIGSGQICLVHVGQSEMPMPTICATGEARTPIDPDGVLVILSRDHLVRFLKFVGEQKEATATDRAAFGAYEIRSSFETDGTHPILSKVQMQAVIEQLIDLVDSEQRASEQLALNDVLRRLTEASEARGTDLVDRSPR
jgi:hypothetical protein